VCVCYVVGPAKVAELNASNLAVDAAMSAANELASQTNAASASTGAVADDIASLLTALDNNTVQTSQLNDRCEYCDVRQIVRISLSL